MAKPPRKSRQYERFYEAQGAPIGFGAIASGHYKSAILLLQQADNLCASARSKYSPHVLSAICLFHACLECYLNEELSLSLLLQLSRPKDDSVTARCLVVQDKTFGKEKLVEFLDLYGLRERIDTAVLEEVVALCELRDRLYHHSPETRPINDYPVAAAAALQRVGIKPINTQWTNMISHLKVGRWARTVTERFLTAHCAAKNTRFVLSGDPGSWNWTGSIPPSQEAP